MIRRLAIVKNDRIIDIVMVDDSTDYTYPGDHDETIWDDNSELFINSVRTDGVWGPPEDVPVDPNEMDGLLRVQRDAVEVNKIILFEQDLTPEREEDLYNLMISTTPEWIPGESYLAERNDIVSYEGFLYRCIQSHVSQEDWFPTAVPALWTRYDPPGTIPEWRQPLGSEDAYNFGDIVTHNGKTWISLYDANVWEPGIFGWDEIV